MRILFVTAHLAAHVKNAENGDSDFWRIANELEAQAPPRFLPGRKTDEGSTGSLLLEAADRVFFCGDLNFRVDLSREQVEHSVHQMKDILESDSSDAVERVESIRRETRVTAIRSIAGLDCGRQGLSWIC